MILWELDSVHENFQEWEKRGIVFVTHYEGIGTINGEKNYLFQSLGLQTNKLTGIEIRLPHPSSEQFIPKITFILEELLSILSKGSLLIRFPAERQQELEEILALIFAFQQLDSNNYEPWMPQEPFGRSLKDWKKEFSSKNNSFLRKKPSNHFVIEKSNESNKNNNQILEDLPPQKEELVKSDANLNTTNQNQTNPLGIIDKPKVNENDIKKEDNLSNYPINKAEVSQPQKEENTTIPKQTKETKQESIEVKRTKYPLQLKMMGITSLILIATVSTIIALATFYFRDDSEKRVQVNTLAIVDLVGLKVASDIQNIIENATKLVESSLRSGVRSEDRKFITNLFFSNDKDFIFVGLFTRKNDELNSLLTFTNDDILFESNISEQDIMESIERNKESIFKAFLGKPIIINSSPGFPVPSFILAISANDEDPNRSNVLIIKVKLDRILPAFEKKDITTTFMVSEEGKVIAHPSEEVIKSAPDFSDLPIVQSLLTSQVDTGQLRYKSNDNEPFLGSFRKIDFGNAGIVSIVPEKKAFEEVYNLQQRNLYIMGVSLCLALIIVFYFAKSITKPILTLLSATLEIAKGNFRVNIHPTTQDEIGLLTSYFIKMGEGLEEREKVKSILGSMIDPVVVKEAMIDLAALKRGKEAYITAFFSDVASFSTISEQLTSVELASLLNEYLSAMTIILKENEGVLDKYIGDAIVGIFGAPVDVEDHPFKACKASIEMIHKLDELRQYWQKNNLYSKDAQTMDARIGLNTGPAKVGFMGTDALASYTMMGDTVNLAARLEAAGKDYGVNIMIAENTYKQVEGRFETRLLDLIRVKGKNEPVRVYELAGFLNELPASKKESLKIYEEAFQNYLNQNWDKSIKLFEEAIKARGGKDKAATMLIERCLSFKSNPPRKDWDGVYTRTTK